MEGYDVSAVGISELPVEVLEALLNNVSTMKLLLNCRSVSRLWKSVSSSICRARNVKLANGRADDSRIVATFQDLDNLPWSSCSISKISRPDVMGQDRATTHQEAAAHKNVSHIQINPVKFAMVFGNHIRHLTLDYFGHGVQTVLQTLHLTPNITHLNLPFGYEYYEEEESSTGGSPKTEFPQKGELSLRYLQKLKIFVDRSDESISLLRFLSAECNSTLKRVKICLEIPRSNFDEQISENVCDVLVRANIPKVELSLQITFYDDFNVDELVQEWSQSTKKLNIGSLVLTFMASVAKEFNYDAFEETETFVKNCADTLEELEIKYQCYSTWRPFRIPYLPKLKQLAIDFDNLYAPPKSGSMRLDTLKRFTINYISEGRETVRSAISELRTNQFPVLEKLELIDTGGSLLEEIFGSIHFDCVQGLKMDCHLPQEKWHQVFPNLKSLDTIARNRNSLVDILTNMNMLEILKLTIEADEEINDLFQSDTPDVSLLSFTELQTLELCFTSRKIRLNNRDALGLLHIQPLKRLFLCNADISTDFEDELKSRHNLSQGKD